MFLAGCGLPRAWAGRTRFTIAELGLGTGLNLAALLDLWRREGPPNARLHLFSVEAHLISRDEAARALKRWRGEIGDAIDALLAVWPGARRGFVRLDLPAFRATLDLYLGPVEAALARWSGPADAWFLDGFAPSRNPDMWSEAVLAALGRLSAPGARLATFTVAGRVRRGLEGARFVIDKRPGFAAKRERLEGRHLSEAVPERRAPSRVAVIGAGIAGAALARALLAEGIACTVLEAERAGAGASGNPAALVTPRLDAGFGPPAELHAQAFARAVDLYRFTAAAAILAEGALQLGAGERDAARFARLAAWDGFASGALTPSDDPSQALDEPAAAAPSPALRFRDALVVEPAVVLEAWLAGAHRIEAEVARLERGSDGGWRLFDPHGRLLAEADAVVLAAGAAAGRLAPGLALRPIRGQAEFTSAPVFSGEAAAWGAYAVPLRDGGVLFGASHVRDDEDRSLRAEESAASLDALALRRPELAARVCALPPEALEARAAIRASTADHMPVAGEAEPGLFVLGGLGGRGFTLAPLLAEHLAARIAGGPTLLPGDLEGRLDPKRLAPTPSRERQRTGGVADGYLPDTDERRRRRWSER